MGKGVAVWGREKKVWGCGKMLAVGKVWESVLGCGGGMGNVGDVGKCWERCEKMCWGVGEIWGKC